VLATCSLQSLGDIQNRLLQQQAAKMSYKLALEAYDKVLTLAPDDIKAYNNLYAVI